MNQAFLYLEAIQRDTSNARIVDTMCQFQAIVTPVKYQAPIAKKEIFHPWTLKFQPTTHLLIQKFLYVKKSTLSNSMSGFLLRSIKTSTISIRVLS